MHVPRNMRGHFSSLWTMGGPILVPTTVTSQRKSKVRAREMAKRAELCADIEVLTGKPAERISRSIDGVSRRWSGVKSHTSD